MTLDVVLTIVVLVVLAGAVFLVACVLWDRWI